MHTDPADVVVRADRLTAEKSVFTAGRPVLDEVTALRALAAHGVLGPEQMLDPRLTVVDESRRCRCLIVRLADAGWVVKQGTSAETQETLDREAEVYRVLRGSSFAPYLPRFSAFDDHTGLLVTEFVDGQAPRDAHIADPARRPVTAVGIGAALARLHTVADDGGLPAQQPPPILRCGHPTLDSIEFHSPASLEVVRTIQSSPALSELLDGVHEQWSPGAMGHGDLRGDNILIRPSGEPVFIDWEMGGPGDRRWDIAGLLTERIVWWLTDPDAWVPMEAQATANAAAAAGLREIREFAHAFLGSYVVTYAGELDLAKAGLDDLMRWCGARLVQFAVEQTHQRSVPLATSRQLLQMAANFHTTPGVAARTFFGLAIDDGDR
ncbi:phosphotransferase family protein [Herbidospora yilanensis]|uniref:phosphotransferase family protein n=1 Tax=Herbidospora yilanensis TaxID=354426 RepID=UPI0007865521|nr:aminoglycoside phosphotransferase family protein [Herbidospora yilanensis]